MEKNMPKDKLNKKSFKRFLLSFKYCYEGMKYAFYNQVNMFVMIIFALIILLLGMLLKISYVESLIIVLLIGIVFALELVNSAIEEVTNLVTKENNIHAKHAKDCAGGAVGFMIIISIIMGLMIYLPKLVLLFK